jgi:hypothetical protein
MGLFQKEFVSELNTKNLGNSTSFLTTMQTIPSAKRFRGKLNFDDQCRC